MPVFRVQREDGYKRVTIANSLENAQKIVAATAVQRLTALEVLERACVGLDAFEDVVRGPQVGPDDHDTAPPAIERRP